MKKLLTICLFLGLVLPASLFADDNIGSISGKVLDGSTGEKLPEAVIRIENTGKAVASDVDGNYEFKGIKTGQYNLKASYVGYVSRVISIEIKPGENLKIDIILDPETTSTDTIDINAERIYNNDASVLLKQKKADNISDGISEQQMKRTPDAFASDVLKRVIGVSILNDKFIYVRGTSERYSNTTLNNIQLPSTEPDKKAFSFDLFPSNFLENIIISKSFTADQPGNFSGGLVQLTTKDIPDQLTLSFSTSASYTAGTSTQGNFLTYDAGQTKWLFFNSGFDDGNRSLPSNFPDHPFGGANSYGKSFRNNWKQSKVKAPLNGGFQLTAGNRFTLFGNPLGMLLSYSYKNSFQNNTFVRTEYNEDTTRVINFTGRSSEYSVNNGGLLNLAYMLGTNHKFSFKNTLSITSEDLTEYMEGFRILVFTQGDEDRKLYKTAFTERSLFSSLLNGSHFFLKFNNMTVNWKASYSESKRNEPDMKTAYYRKDYGSDDPYIIPLTIITNPNVGKRFYSELYDINRNFGLDFDMDFIKIGNNPKSKIKFGGLITGSNRSFRARSFEPFRSGPYVNVTLPIELIFAPENIDPSILSYAEVTSYSDSYNASDKLYASYVSFDMPFWKFRLVAGLRFEYSELRLEGFDRQSPVVPKPVQTLLKGNDYLPSVNLTYSLNDKINIRASFSQTVSRPEYREIAPYGFIDFVTEGELAGNPNLKSCLIQNYDLRFELYPNPGEIIALSLFYKHFNQPIEKVIVPTILSSIPSYSFANAENGAINYGIEIEARKNLGFLSNKLRFFSINANVAFISSQVDLSGTSTAASEKTRRLQGQSPYLVNIGLYYDNYESGTSVNLSYNKIGDKISEVGRIGFKDVFEEGRNLVDFSISQKLFGNIELKFTAKDIFSNDIVFTKEVKKDVTSNEYVKKVVRRITTGTTFSFTLGYKY
jgi:hypothetical protein